MIGRLRKRQRKVRREANKLLARRRHREITDGVKASVWSVRKGPAGPSEKAKKRAEKRAEPVPIVKRKRVAKQA